MTPIIMVLFVLLSSNTTVVFDDSFQEAFVGEYTVLKEDVSFERHENGITRVFGETTTGEKAYIIYDNETVKAKIWGEQQTRIVESGKIFPLF